HGAGAGNPALPAGAARLHPRPDAGGNQGMRGRSLLLNRFVLVPGGIVAAALAWTVYVSFHNGGIIQGRVVDASGQPAAGAQVTLLVLNVTTFADKAQAKTDAEGRFRFADNPPHPVQLHAETAAGRPERL